MPAKRTSGHQVQDEATTVAQANFLNFTGAGVSVATSAGTTAVTISGAGTAETDFSAAFMMMGA